MTQLNPFLRLAANLLILFATLFAVGCIPGQTATSEQQAGSTLDTAVSTIASALKPVTPSIPSITPTEQTANCLEQDLQTYRNEVVGVEIAFPSNLTILEDQYLSNDFGFTLINSVGDSILRVAWLYESEAEDQPQLINEIVRQAGDISVQQTAVEVDGKTAAMLSPVPGEVANTLIFIPTEQKLYLLRYYKTGLDERDLCLIENLRFFPPEQSLEELKLTPAAEALHSSSATETAIIATETAAAQAEPTPETGTPDALLPPTPITLSDVSSEWTQHDFPEWGISLSMPADWDKSRMEGSFSFTPPTGDNTQLTVGLQTNAPAELTAMTEMMNEQWSGLTSQYFYTTSMVLDGVEGVAYWNLSPYNCVNIYIPQDGIVRAISLGSTFCNDAHDQLNEAGQEILDSIDIYAPP